jgi:precorrin-8X/cobalt-precorrin-8 methylmutase
MASLIPPYIRDPAAIERESFRQIRVLTDLSAFGPLGKQVAMRVVHTCGEPEIVRDLLLSEAAVAAGIDAVARAAPILCDVEMVRHGITRRYLDSDLLCFLNDDQTRALAADSGDTRSMAALALWRPHVDGAIAVFGNAPTALFRLLELIEAGEARPALVIGMPVGFIGAAESKDALCQVAERHGIPAISLRGRRGGSAIAAACVNAIARLARGERY